MSPNLPSQKLFIIFIPVIIGLGIFAMVHEKGTPQKIKNQANYTPQVVSVQNAIINETDTDGDGVPDWEEVIWKTDLNKPNTYGIPDKSYISQKTEEEKNATSTSATLNNTERLSQELFTQYVALQQAGQLNDAAIKTMTERIAQSADVTSANTLYTASSFKTFSNSDNVRMQTYANNLMNINSKYITNFKNKTENLQITLGNPDFAKTMAEASTYYSKMAAELSRIPIPEGAVQYHLAYVNTIEQSAEGLLEFSKYTDDPLSSLVGIQRHAKAEVDQSTAIENLTSFLNQNGILEVNLIPF